MSNPEPETKRRRTEVENLVEVINYEPSGGTPPPIPLPTPQSEIDSLIKDCPEMYQRALDATKAQECLEDIAVQFRFSKSLPPSHVFLVGQCGRTLVQNNAPRPIMVFAMPFSDFQIHLYHSNKHPVECGINAGITF